MQHMRGSLNVSWPSSGSWSSHQKRCYLPGLDLNSSLDIFVTLLREQESNIADLDVGLKALAFSKSSNRGMCRAERWRDKLQIHLLLKYHSRSCTSLITGIVSRSCWYKTHGKALGDCGHDYLILIV